MTSSEDDIKFFKTYISDRVFLGKRPIPKERVKALKEMYLENHPVVGFKEEDGVRFAGNHTIADFWGARGLKDAEFIEDNLTEAADHAGAEVLYSCFHTFGPEQGVTGVLVLSESHISIHTWPEEGYAAIDIFMCGKAKPSVALEVLKRVFKPERVIVGNHKRGVI